MAGYTPNCACSTTQLTAQATQSNYITVNGKQVLKQFLSPDHGKMLYAHIDPSGNDGVVYKSYAPGSNTTQQKPSYSNPPQGNQSQVQTRVIYRTDAYGRTQRIIQRFIPAQPKQNPIDRYSPSSGGSYKPESDTRKPEDFPLPLVKQKGTKDPSEDPKIEVQRNAQNLDNNIVKPPSGEEVQPKVVTNNDEKPSKTPSVNGSKALPALNSNPEFSTYAILKPNQKFAKPIMTEKGAASFSVTNNSSREITIERKENRYGDYEYRASYLAEDRSRSGKMKTDTYNLGGNYKYDNKFNHSTYNFGSDRFGEVRLNNREDKKFYSNLPRESVKDLTPRRDIKLTPGKDSVSYLYPQGSANSTKTVIVDGHEISLTNESSSGFAYVISRQQQDGSFKTYVSTDSNKVEQELTKDKYISGLNIKDLGKTETQIKLEEAEKEQEKQKAKEKEELPIPKNQEASNDLEGLNQSKKEEPNQFDDIFKAPNPSNKGESRDPLEELFQPIEKNIKSENSKDGEMKSESSTAPLFKMFSEQQNNSFFPDSNFLNPKIDLENELKKINDAAKFTFPVK